MAGRRERRAANRAPLPRSAPAPTSRSTPSAGSAMRSAGRAALPCDRQIPTVPNRDAPCPAPQFPPPNSQIPLLLHNPRTAGESITRTGNIFRLRLFEAKVFETQEENYERLDLPDRRDRDHSVHSLVFRPPLSCRERAIPWHSQSPAKSSPSS